MVTVRTYWNLAEAALAKSLLDDYEIFCALIHENAHLYGRAPYAMPIRLIVDENQADEAICILSGDVEAAAEMQMASAARLEASTEAHELSNNNPWELLAVAFYFFLPAICVLQIKHPHFLTVGWLVRREIAAIDIIHLLGWLGVIFAGFLIAVYFYALRSQTGIKYSHDDEWRTENELPKD